MKDYLERARAAYTAHREMLELNIRRIDRGLSDEETERLQDLEQRCDDVDEKGIGFPEGIGAVLVIAMHPIAYTRMQIDFR